MSALPKFVRAMSALVFTTAMAQATAQTDFPNKPITLLVGSAPGGSNDVFARVIGKQLQDVLGVSVVVENKPAAGGILANVLLAKAPADGYTLVVLSSTFTTGAAVRKNLQYDAITSFTPIAMLAKGPMLITVGNNTPYKTLEDLVKFAKANPGKLNYGTSGVGSINQFASELLSEAAGIKMTHVPYKGMGPAVTDLLSGHIDMIIASAPSLLSQVKSEKIRALGVTTVERSEVAPDISGLKEAGLPKAAVDLWWGVLAPAGTPKPVVDKLKSFFVKEGATPFAVSPEAFASHLATELERWKVIAQNANIQAE
ncbi:MAG: tripartite tricarboxylate transporter substrate binding protein [Burkholderiales bacterium]|nr:tripartite tricarboxylate transporter substrate binding protein [Burkholderiales bacterium]